LEVSPPPHMPTDPGTTDPGTTRHMGLGIPATDTMAGIAALEKDTQVTTTAAAMLCRGTAGMDRHITVMAPVLGEDIVSPGTDVGNNLQAGRGPVVTSMWAEFKIRHGRGLGAGHRSDDTDDPLLTPTCPGETPAEDDPRPNARNGRPRLAGLLL
jgi:hypothetical protein